MANKNINLPHKGKQDTFRDLYIFQFIEYDFTKCTYFLCTYCRTSDLTKPFPIN